MTAAPEPPPSLQDLVRRLGDFTHDAILVTEAGPPDEAGPRIVHVNAAFTAMTGYEPHEVVGRAPGLLQGPRTDPAQRRRIAGALRRREPVVAELEHVRKDGRPFWVELSAAPVADAGGRVHWWVVVQRDITARRAHEAQNALDAHILASLDEGILVADATDPELPVVFVNQAACILTGYERAEMLGRNCRFLQGPESDPADVARLRAAIDAGESVTVELTNHRRDGTAFRNQLSLTPQREPGGRVVRYIGVLRDVTALRERERQLALAQGLTAVGELAGGIAHDFNNLLSSIIGAAQVLDDRLAASPEHAGLVRAIADSARRGAAQVRRLMTLAHGPSPGPGVADLRHVVRQLLQLTRRTLREHVTLTVALADDATWIAADAVQTESALLNLILNAQDAMPQGGHVRVASRRVLQGGCDHVVVDVEDTGTGMEPAVVERLFTPFFTTKAPGRGSGLGLAMTHAFMRQVGGEVRVSSWPGQGSRFELWFPSASPPDAQPAEPAPASTASVRSLAVLMVEDDPVLRLTGSAMLAHLGHRVVTCADGMQALEVLAGDEPLDLLFTDLLMPGGIDGWDLANRSAALRPGLPVVVTSGWADTALTPPQGRLRASVFLQKPYSLQDLAGGIAEALRMVDPPDGAVRPSPAVV